MKRFLAVLLCLVMLFSLAPYSAFAEGEGQDASVTEQVNDQTEEETKQEETAETPAEEEKQEESAESSAELGSGIGEETFDSTGDLKFMSLASTTYVCQIGTHNYSTVATAFASKYCVDGATIVMINDSSSESKSATLSTDISITLDLNGHCLKNSESLPIIKVTNGNLTIKDGAGDGKIDGSGETYSYGRGIRIEGGTVKLESGTIDSCEATSNGGAVYVKSGTFQMSGGAITNCKASNGGAVYLNTDQSTFTMSGGIIDSSSSVCASKGTFSVTGGVLNCNIVGNNATKTATGGWFVNGSKGIDAVTVPAGYYKTSECSDALYATAPCTVVSSENYSVEYKNGTVEGDSKVTQAHGTKITLPTPTPTSGNEGKNFTGWNTNEDGTGTTFAAEQDVEFAANSTTLYAQWASDPVATVTFGEVSKNCYTFKEAVDEANDAGTATISLIADEVTMSEVATITGADVTLDLNGKTLTNDSDKRTFYVSENAKLVIKDDNGNGTINTSDSYHNANGSGIYVKDKGTLVINAGTINCRYSGTESNKDIYAQSGAAIEISGGSIIGIFAPNSGATVEVTGGWFSNAVKDSYVPEGYVATGAYVCGAPEKTPYAVKAEESAEEFTVTYKDDEVTSEVKVSDVAAFTLPDGEKEGYVFDYWYVEGVSETHYNAGAEVWTNANVTFVASRSKIVAQVTTGSGEEASTTNYSSFDDAFSAACNAGTATIILVNDSEITESKLIDSGKSITLDLNGKKLTAAVEQKTFSVSGSFTIQDSSETHTGAIEYTNSDSVKTGRVIYVNNADGAKLNIVSGTIKSSGSKTDGNDIHIYTKGETTDTYINITGGTINASVYAGSNAVVIKVSGGWFRDEISSKWTLTDETGVEYKAVKVKDESKIETPHTLTSAFNTLTFDIGKGISGSGPDSKNVPKLDGYELESYNTTIPTKVPLKSRSETGELYIFDYWCTTEDGNGTKYYCGDTYNLTSDSTLYAIYKVNDNPAAAIGTYQYSTVTEAIDSAKSDEIVKILADEVSENIKVVDGRDVTLDLCGKSLKNSSTGSCISISLGGALKITDSSEDNSGSISGTAQSTGGGIDNAGKLVIEGGSISGIAPGSGGGLYNSGTVIMNGGNISGTAANYGGAVYNKGDFTLNGGTISGIAAGKGGVSVYNKLNFTVSGEKACVDDTIVNSSGTVTISQGQFKIEPSEDYIPTWSECTESKEAEAEYKYFVDYRDLVIQTTSRISGTNRTIAAVTGGGSYTHAEDVTITAPAVKGFTFLGWFESTDMETAVCKEYSYTFTPEKDVILYAVYDPHPSEDETFTLNIDATAFTVKIGNDDAVPYTSKTYEPLSILASSSVTVEFTDTKEFLHWKNVSGKILPTIGTEYSFVMCSDVTLTAESYTKSSTSAKVIFKSAYGQIMSVQTCDQATEITIPSGPSKLGYTFTKWKFVDDDKTDVTADNIKDKIPTSGGVINIEPVYKDATDTYDITVIYSDSIKGDASYEGIIIGQSCKVTADNQIAVGEGESATTYNFLYWTDKDANILSYDKEYYVRALEDVTIYAIYSKDVETVTKDVCINITGKAKTESGDNTKDRYTITEYYNLPEDYSLVKVGYVYTTDSQLGTEYRLILDNDGIKNSVSSLTDNEGIYALNMNFEKGVDKTVYVRGYVQYTKPNDTNVYIMYTGMETVTHTANQ